MYEFFEYTPLTIGSKGLVFVGDKILVYRRDGRTASHPNELDLPGGAPDEAETPFETFARELCEEFALNIDASDIVYVRKYPSTSAPGTYAFFPVAKLPAAAEAYIAFGNEGVEYFMMTPDEFVRRTDAWKVLQDRTIDYLKTLN